MLAVARECETYEIALARGIVVAQTVVGKIVQLIVLRSRMAIDWRAPLSWVRIPD